MSTSTVNPSAANWTPPVRRHNPRAETAPERKAREQQEWAAEQEAMRVKPGVHPGRYGNWTPPTRKRKVKLALEIVPPIIVAADEYSDDIPSEEREGFLEYVGQCAAKLAEETAQAVPSEDWRTALAKGSKAMNALGEILPPETVACNALERMTDAEFTTTATNTYRKLVTIGRDEWMPIVSDARRRFKDTGHIGEFKGIEDWYRHIGVKPATVRSWFHRERKAKLLETANPVQPDTEPRALHATVQPDTEPITVWAKYSEEWWESLSGVQLALMGVYATAVEAAEAKREYGEFFKLDDDLLGDDPKSIIAELRKGIAGLTTLLDEWETEPNTEWLEWLPQEIERREKHREKLNQKQYRALMKNHETEEEYTEEDLQYIAEMTAEVDRSQQEYREAFKRREEFKRAKTAHDLELKNRIISEGKKALAKKSHPDIGGSTEDMQAINATADSMLKDLEKATA
jgi:hypothetical protein